MSDSSGIASKTWRALKRTASGLGSSRRSQGDSPTSLSAQSPKLSDGPQHGGHLQNGNFGHCQTEPIPEVTQNGHRQNGMQPDPRAEFLEAYDSATLEIVNRVFGAEASCIAAVELQSVAPWNRVPGFLGHLSEAQQEALQQLRSHFPESRRWHTDHDLLRFLRAREFDLAKTQEMYARYITEYRGRHMISPNPVVRKTEGPFSNELLELFPPRDPALTERMRKLVDWFLHTMAFGVDLDGRPVVYFRPSDIVKQNMMKHVPVADRIAFQSAANETLLVLVKMASKRAGFHIENITQILDLSGMSAIQMVSHMRSSDAQKEWQHNMDFMPEILHKVYVINAPSGMSMVWKVASYFLPARTKQKINVLGSTYRAELVSAVGRENLPSCYGGDCPFEWPQHRSLKDLEY